ncbi:DUF3291 domain-containing protein [Endozoicomonas elysicola]|uniref:DUF3291 domain-containing protein n=1 Tax=Endozoicomonas elysicola TaxID=305900 RepID=A0A081KA99_9GAMM|nr:DUF3291 domain-containing protein [Endozoicomonas elysicola]KEI71075.1 hypothetical protein GV64_10245 [Endozoicomonas elysicola]
MARYHLAQVNIAKAKGPMDSAVMKGFVDQLDYINQLADNSPGFVWRLQTEEGDATDISVFDDELIIINMSVWQTYEDLKQYVYSGEHLSVLKQKKDWFDKLPGSHLALWWIPSDTIPTVEEGKQALESLDTQGPTEKSFTFARPYPAPELKSA